MTRLTTRSPVNRELTNEEKELLRWLLKHGKSGAERHLEEIDTLRVVALCDCGCATIEFDNQEQEGLDPISDYQWQDEQGRHFGVFVFRKGTKLSGLEVYSLDGEATPTRLPDPRTLVPVT